MPGLLVVVRTESNTTYKGCRKVVQYYIKTKSVEQEIVPPDGGSQGVQLATATAVRSCNVYSHFPKAGSVIATHLGNKEIFLDGDICAMLVERAY